MTSSKDLQDSADGDEHLDTADDSQSVSEGGSKQINIKNRPLSILTQVISRFFYEKYAQKLLAKIRDNMRLKTKR